MNIIARLLISEILTTIKTILENQSTETLQNVEQELYRLDEGIDKGWLHFKYALLHLVKEVLGTR